MADAAHQALRDIIDYCSRQCWEIGRAEPPPDGQEEPEAPGIRQGRKLAYKDVLQHAYTLIDRTP